MIALSGGRDVTMKSSTPWPQAWPYPIPPGPELVGGGAFGGGYSIARLIGLPALLGIILRSGQSVGQVPLKVYRGVAADREPAIDSWQYERIHDEPSRECGADVFYADMGASLAGAGYSVVRKYKSRGMVADQRVLDATKVKPYRDNTGRLAFDDTTDGNLVTRYEDEILYVRGLALGGSPVGLSPIAAARLGLSTALQRQIFEHQYYANNAESRVVLTGPDNMTPKQADDWLDVWEGKHREPDQWHSVSAIGGGFSAAHIPIKLSDAQFVEANNMTGEQLGAIYGMPKSFLNVGNNSPTQEDWRFFVTFGLGWMLGAIAQAYTRDRDFFPREPRRENRMITEHVTEALTKPDLRTRYEAYKAARQAGWMTSNEIRALENLPPHPDGDVLQVIPVGGGEPSQTSADELLDELHAIAVELGGEERRIVERAIARGKAQLALA